ncbi:hypothetical protein TPENAI_60290 [Tenacibaculum litopenaei]|uniref:hypothetical protein n=1 Tax=Tenacibaculum litopenaei TaxID=396016 RepID=UPI003892F3EB
MVNLIQDNRSLIKLTLLFFIIISCKTLKYKREPFSIGFSSLYENDRCTLILNDSLYFDNTKIKTNQSLGIDLVNGVTVVDASELRLSLKFFTEIEKELNINRSISLDTVLFKKNGYNILIFAGAEKIKIIQQFKAFTLD